MSLAYLAQFEWAICCFQIDIQGVFLEFSNWILTHMRAPEILNFGRVEAVDMVI